MAGSRAVLQRANLFRIAGAVLALWCASFFSACGSSTTSTTSPSTISRCPVTVRPFDGVVPAQGGSGTLAVSAERDCTWTASVEGSWLSISAGASGQGSGTVQFSAAANPDPATRRGAVVLSAQRTEIIQDAAPCGFSLVESSANVGPEGGTGAIQVRASSGMCGWTAASDAAWITVRPASGTGSGQVVYEVAPTDGPPRSATVTLAGQKFSITQSVGCGYSIAPASRSVPPSGGSAAVAVAAGAACPWTASSNADWITVAPGAGTGPATVTATAAASSGPSRTGTAVIAGQLFTITQTQGCSYDVEPTAGGVPAAGGTVAVRVDANTGCAWSASSEASWIVVQGSASRTGAGTVTLAVAATTGPARSGAAVVAGQRVTIAQSAGCSYAISPESATIPPAGGTGTVAVTAGAGCPWTASSNTAWLTIASGASGTGSGEVRYSVPATGGPARTATMTVAGRTFTVTQGEGCAYSLSSTTMNIDDEGGEGRFTIRTGGGCAWTAASDVSWITVTSPASGTGEAEVRFTVGRNGGPPRAGTITAGGQIFTVEQGSGCAYSLSAESHNVPAAGGAGSVSVRAPAGCGWTAASGADWLTITTGSSGSGDGAVGFAAAPNTGAARAGALTIAGRTFTVSQEGACAFSIAPQQAGAPAAGGPLHVAVTAPAGCSWTAQSHDAWLTVAEGSAGTGSGSVRIDAAPNTGGARNGTVTIAGQPFTVAQASGCTFVVAPDQLSAPAAGAAARIEVTTAASCTWAAESGAAWIVIPSVGAGGTGSGGIDVTVAANTGPARSGVLTVAGIAVAVAQASGCVYALSSASQPMPAAGGQGFVNVIAGPECPWTAQSHVEWITVTSGASGTGAGTVQFTVSANTTGAPRSGTMTIAGLTFTVNQE